MLNARSRGGKIPMHNQVKRPCLRPRGQLNDQGRKEGRLHKGSPEIFRFKRKGKSSRKMRGEPGGSD